VLQLTSELIVIEDFLGDLLIDHTPLNILDGSAGSKIIVEEKSEIIFNQIESESLTVRAI
jgi:hypothetical protein